MAHNNQRLALFFTPAQISWLSVGLGSLPRAIRDSIRRDLDRQLADHGLDAPPAPIGTLPPAPEARLR
jgi:hypothetical protein